MEALRGGEDFEALSAAAKRIRNILAKSATAADWQAGEVAPELLTEPQEKDLYDSLREDRRGSRTPACRAGIPARAGGDLHSAPGRGPVF